MKIVQALKNSKVLIIGVTKTIKKEDFKYFRDFRSLFVRKFISRKRNCKTWLWKIKRKMNCESWFWKAMGILMSPHSLTNFETKRYYQNHSRFNGVFFKK